MTIILLSHEEIAEAVAHRRELMQLFTDDRTITGFMPMKEFLKLEYNPQTQLPWYILHHEFDYNAYNTWVRTKQENHTDHDVSVFAFIERAHPGITITKSGETLLSEQFIIKGDRPESPKKYRAEFFPEGTVFTTSRMFAGMSSEKMLPAVLIARRVIQNDIDSYVIETTALHRNHFTNEVSFVKVNVEHVENILLRGNGKLSVERLQSPSVAPYQNCWAKDDFPGIANKNQWLLFSSGLKVAYEVNGRNVQAGACVDFGFLLWNMAKQSFSKRIVLDRYTSASIMSKKKAKRYMKQNLNRYLKSARKLQEVVTD